MHRFFIPQERIEGDKVCIKGKQALQIHNVLRAKPGQSLIVLDNTGFQYQIKLSSVDKNMVRGEIIDCSFCPNEPKVQVHLYQALLKGSKFEFVLQKCTEVGVASFTPMLCERCVSRDIGKTRMSRWQTIITEAAEQSQRGKLPLLEPLLPFEKACDSAFGLSMLPWEEESELGLKNVLRERNATTINIFIGPEGGFSAQEVEFARSRGIIPVTLGKRVLRAETAALVAVTLVLYECGELGS